MHKYKYEEIMPVGPGKWNYSNKIDTTMKKYWSRLNYVTKRGGFIQVWENIGTESCVWVSYKDSRTK